MLSCELADAILLQCALPLGIDDRDPNLREFSFKLSRDGQCGFLSWMFRFQPSIDFKFKTDFRQNLGVALIIPFDGSCMSLFRRRQSLIAFGLVRKL